MKAWRWARGPASPWSAAQEADVPALALQQSLLGEMTETMFTSHWAFRPPHH